MINKVYETLKEFCDGKVFPFIADEKTTEPYIIITPVSNVIDDVFCGQTSSTQAIQVDIYHNNFTELSALKNEVIQAIKILSVFEIRIAESFESETKLYRAMIEFKLIK